MYILEDEGEPFSHLIEDLRLMFLKSAEIVDVGEWHAQKVTDPSLVSRELQNTVISFPVPATRSALQDEVAPNLPWAEDHFGERVSGLPLNPPPSNEWWPFAQSGNAVHKSEEKFSHTYPERFWPKFAQDSWGRMRGIRFEVGDLRDVVRQLVKNPDTRQAYLPVWFPEDTGATEGQRVPCTLGYHFMVRRGKLHCSYYIRSCDYMRHFRDDFYMAGRLMQWICAEVKVAGGPLFKPGDLVMYIASFHVFEGDLPKLKGLVT